MSRMLAEVETGVLRAFPVSEFPLAEAAEAHRALQSGTTTGKLALHTLHQVGEVRVGHPGQSEADGGEVARRVAGAGDAASVAQFHRRPLHPPPGVRGNRAGAVEHV